LDHHTVTQLLRNNSPTTRCRTTPPLRNRAINPPQQIHHSRNLRNPSQRPSPPNLPGQSYARVGPAKLPPVAQQHSHLAQQLYRRQTQKRTNPRILQRRYPNPPPLQNRRQPPRDPSAKSALCIEKQPASRVPPLPIGKFRSQRNHDLAPLLCDLYALLSVPSVLKLLLLFLPP
jgi:hypothetical protein